MNKIGRTTAKLNLREGPSKEYDVLKVLANGSRVQFVESSYDGNWSLVHAIDTGLTGWVFNKYIDWEETRRVAAVIPLDSVNKVHSWPTYNIGLRGKYDRDTGLLKSGKWRIKDKLIDPADVWSGAEPTFPWKSNIGVGTGEFHGAVDIVPEPRGSNPSVRSAFPGKVVKTASQGRPHKNQVVILTNIDDIEFLVIYQHLGSDFRVKKGDTVVSGQVIGSLGEWYGIEHLHAELISKESLPGVNMKWGVPCKSGATANSQFPDVYFNKWIKLPYFMYNLVAIVEWYNKRYDDN